MLRRLIPIAAVAAVAAVPAAASARTIHGTVVKRSHDGHSFVVSDCSTQATAARIHSARRAPRLGARVSVVAHRRHRRWEASHVRRQGSLQGACKLEGTITAIDPTARTLTLAADDHGSDTNPAVTVTVPAGFDLSKFAVGDDVELKVVAKPDGTLQLVRAEDEQGEDQGDDHGDDPAGHDQGDDPAGHDQGDDPAGHDQGDDPAGHDQGDDHDNSGPGGGGHDD